MKDMREGMDAGRFSIYFFGFWSLYILSICIKLSFIRGKKIDFANRVPADGFIASFRVNMKGKIRSYSE